MQQKSMHNKRIFIKEWAGGGGGGLSVIFTHVYNFMLNCMCAQSM